MKKSDLNYLDIHYDINNVTSSISIKIVPKNRNTRNSPNDNNYREYLIELKNVLEFISNFLDEFSGELFNINDEEKSWSYKEQNYISKAQERKIEMFENFLETLIKNKNEIVIDILQNLHDKYKQIEGLTDNADINYNVNVFLNPSDKGNSKLTAGLKNVLNSINRVCRGEKCFTIFTQDQMKSLLFHRRLFEGSLFQIFGKYGYGIGNDAFPIIEKFISKRKVEIDNVKQNGGKSRKVLTKKKANKKKPKKQNASPIKKRASINPSS